MTYLDHLDMAHVRGQHQAVHDLALALGDGAHGIALLGPPGTVKTMIARRIPTLLPEFDDRARRWLAAEYEGTMGGGPTWPPFRAPHYSVSTAALVGGTWVPRQVSAACSCKGVGPAHLYHNIPPAVVSPAAELQLARFGVLMLDEVTEFRPESVRALSDALRRMGAGRPFVVVTANPCPCGFFGVDLGPLATRRDCLCSDAAIERYQARLRECLDVLDILCTTTVPFVDLSDMRGLPPGESSASIRARIDAHKAVSP